MPSAKKNSKKAPPTRQQAAADHFVQGLLARGEAVYPQNGKLPPGATHAIIGKDKDGKPIVERRRFSAI
jgi:hypothetical protein